MTTPVRSDWFGDQGFRLDATPYLSGALEARKRLDALPNTMRLDRVTSGHDGGIFNGPKFSRIYLDNPEHSVPFLGSTDMLEADLSFVPRLSKVIAERLNYLEASPGMSLISCSGTIGRMAYVRSDMAGFWTSQHVMKVQPDSTMIPSGYLYTFLRSRFGIPMIVSSAYGAIIQHIEPHHIADLPVPRFGGALEQRVHELVEESARLRASFQARLAASTQDFFESVGLANLAEYRWHEQERDLGFVVDELSPVSLRAINHGKRASALKAQLASVPHRTLGEICAGGVLSRGERFTRIETGPGEGLRFVGQRQAFWIRPEDRWIKAPPSASLLVGDETIVATARGLPSENGLFGRTILVTGAWTEYAYTEDFLRIGSGDPGVSGAYLYALLRSPLAFRLFRSMLSGAGPQNVHPSFLAGLPIPIASRDDHDRIAETVREAYRERDRADELEDEALELLTRAVEGAEV
ncbi:hypothetical protein ACFS27_22805 [Promicromonospora vindobonensis]|uniref:Type I restriction enzyme S subunit n=1 Tax=Promicromonospora vindobonensis TaxID=195748 RepID=A0ABW5VZS1_9MICO